MSKTTFSLAAVAIGLTFLARVVHAQDHLECYKIKDLAPKVPYTADLAGLNAEPGCTVKVPAKLNRAQRELFEKLRESLPVENEPAEKGIFEKVKDYFM